MWRKLFFSGRRRSHSRNTLDFFWSVSLFFQIILKSAAAPLFLLLNFQSSFIWVYEILNAKRLTSTKSWCGRSSILYNRRRYPQPKSWWLAYLSHPSPFFLVQKIALFTVEKCRKLHFFLFASIFPRTNLNLESTFFRILTVTFIYR